MIINLSIDIGIIANPIRHPDLIISKLYDNECTFWTADNVGINKNTINEDAVIVCDPNLPQTESLLKKIKRSKARFPRLLTTNSIESVASLTANHCGIGILPTCYVTYAFPNSLHRIPKMPSHFDEICLVFRSENRNIQAIKVITAAIKKVAQDKLYKKNK
jgi:DNA-binding transcriptional LysR family regulator